MANKFMAAVARTAESDEDVRIEPSDGPIEGGQAGQGPRPQRNGPNRPSGPGGHGAPRHQAKPYRKAPPPRGPSHR
jgi:ATP-dependent RNA helicase DeaD